MYDTTGASEIICLHSLSIITVCQYFINFRLIFNYKNKRTCCVFPVSVYEESSFLTGSLFSGFVRLMLRVLMIIFWNQTSQKRLNNLTKFFCNIKIDLMHNEISLKTL